MFDFFKKKATEKAKASVVEMVETQDDFYPRVRHLMLDGKNEEAERVLREGVQRGLPKCCYFLGAMIEQDTFSGEESWTELLKKAYPSICKLAESGDAEALTILYYYHKNAYVIKMDPMQAIKNKTFISSTALYDYLVPAAEKGYYLAQFQLGHTFTQNGDDETADFWYTKAAEQSTPLQFVLASSYSVGNDLPKDDEKSLYWMSKAAEGGDRRAQCVMASYYANGTFVKKDFAKAKSMAEKSWAQGYEDSKDLIGQIAELERLAKIKDDAMAQVEDQQAVNQLLLREDLEGCKLAVETMERLISRNFAYGMLFDKHLQNRSYKIGTLLEESSDDEYVQEKAFGWYKKAKGLGRFKRE